MNVLITGATSGIGHQLALDYAKDGHTVVACGRKQDALDTLASAYPDQIKTLRFDITDKVTLSALATQEPVDIAILSAGVCEYLDVKHLTPTCSNAYSGECVRHDEYSRGVVAKPESR